MESSTNAESEQAESHRDAAVYKQHQKDTQVAKEHKKTMESRLVRMRNATKHNTKMESKKHILALPPELLVLIIENVLDLRRSTYSEAGKNVGPRIYNHARKELSIAAICEKIRNHALDEIYKRPWFVFRAGDSLGPMEQVWGPILLPLNPPAPVDVELSVYMPWDECSVETEYIPRAWWPRGDECMRLTWFLQLDPLSAIREFFTLGHRRVRKLTVTFFGLDELLVGKRKDHTPHPTQHDWRYECVHSFQRGPDVTKSDDHAWFPEPAQPNPTLGCREDCNKVVKRKKLPEIVLDHLLDKTQGLSVFAEEVHVTMDRPAVWEQRVTLGTYASSTFDFRAEIFGPLEAELLKRHIPEESDLNA